MDFTIRGVAPHEAEAVGELCVTAYLHDGLLDPDGEAPYVMTLRDTAGRAAAAEVLVAAEADGTLLGTVTWSPYGSSYAETSRPGEGEFRMLAVGPRARRRGVAEALVRACLERARAGGMYRVVLSSKEAMTSAHRLYARLGFTRTPERDWSPVPGVDLWSFSLEL